MSTNTESFINLSSQARSEVTKLLDEKNEPGLGLRLSVAGGGCSGLTYKLDFTLQEPGDNVIDAEEGFRIFVDPKSLLYLKNMQVDYQGGLNGKGFVFSNPNAQNTCGCGESFSV